MRGVHYSQDREIEGARMAVDRTPAAVFLCRDSKTEASNVFPTRAAAARMDSPVVTASVVAQPTESIPHCRESLIEAGSSSALPLAGAVTRPAGRYPLRTPAAAVVVPSTRAPASSSSSSTAEAPRSAAGSPSPAAASSTRALAIAAKRLSIADYSSKAVPLLLPLTAQTSSPSRVKFRKQLLRRMGLLLPSGISQQQQQPAQQQDGTPRQQDTREQQQVEARVFSPTKEADCVTAVDDVSNKEEDGKKNCWVYIHPVETAKELRCMCGQLVDAFRVCYMTDQDLYFADAVLQQQEHRRSSSRRRISNSSRSLEESTPHVRPDGSSSSSSSTAASRRHEIIATAEEKTTAELAGEEDDVGARGNNVAPGPAVSACCPAATGETPDSSNTCSCCCCFCCRCCVSSEDEEGLFEEWGRLAHCESPSNLRRALFEVQSRLSVAAAARSGASSLAACPACPGKEVTAAAAALRAAPAVSSTAPVDSLAAPFEPASSAAPGSLLCPQLKQQSVCSIRKAVAQEEGGYSVAVETAVDEEEKYTSIKKRLLVQREDESPITAKESMINTEEAEISVAQDSSATASFLTLYVVHLQHLINRFCAPANEEHSSLSSSSGSKSLSPTAARSMSKGGKSLVAADDEGQGTPGREAHRKQLPEQEVEGHVQQLQQQECEQQQNCGQQQKSEQQRKWEQQQEEERHQQEEEQGQQELSGASMEEEEVSRRCHAEAKKLGVYIHPDVELKKSRKATGRGLFAARRIAAGSVLFEIPQTAMINVYTALQDPVFAPVAEWLLTLRPEEEEEEMQLERIAPEEKEEELRLQQDRVDHLQSAAEQDADCARENSTTVNAESEAIAAAGLAAASARGAAGRNADAAPVSLLYLKGEGRPLVDADTLCLLYFLFEAYRAGEATSSSRKKGNEKDGNSFLESQRQQLEQLPQGRKHEHKHHSEQPERQQDDEDEEEEEGKQKGSRFSFFFELLPARHEEQQQPLIAGPPEVPELLQDVPLSRAIDSSLLRSFDLYRRLLPLLKGAFAADRQTPQATDQHRPVEELQQQRRDTSRQQLAECTQGQEHEGKVKDKQTLKIVHSSDCSSYEAEMGEGASIAAAAAASTVAAAEPPTSTATTFLAGTRAAEKNSSELKAWIDSLTLEQFIWGQCHMGSRAFALQVPPPRDDSRWRRVAVQQLHEDTAAEDEEEAEGEASTQGNEEAFAAAEPAVQEGGAEVRAARAAALTVYRESDPAAGSEDNTGEALALQEGKADQYLGHEEVADPQHEEIGEEEDVVAFLPMLRDRPPRGRSLYYRCTGAAAVPSSSCSFPPGWSPASPGADSPVNQSFPSPAKGRNLSSFTVTCSPQTTSAHSAALTAGHGDTVALVAGSDDSSRTSSDTKRNEEGAGERDKRVGEREKKDGRVGDGRAEHELGESLMSAAAPAVKEHRGGVLHVPDHPTTFLPFVDLANHHVHAQCCFPFFDATTATAKVVAHADIPAAAEIFLFYGPLQSWELLAQFGFTTNCFFALERRKKEQHQPQGEQPRQQRALEQQQKQRQQQSQQSPPGAGGVFTAAAREEEDQAEEKKSARRVTLGGGEEDLFLPGLPPKKQRWDCCGAWSFTKEKHGNPYDTLTLCFEPADEEEEEKSSSRKRQLLSRLFDISTESLLRTGAPHFSPRLLESLQVSLHPDVDQLLRLLLRKKKKQQQHLRQGGRCSNSNVQSGRCCERNENSICHSEDMRQQWPTISQKEDDFDAEEEDEEEEKEELQTLYKTPVVQTVNELMRPCVEALEQLEYWKEHEEERPHWYDAWSSRAAGLLHNQKVLFQKVRDLFDCSLPL